MHSDDKEKHVQREVALCIIHPDGVGLLPSLISMNSSSDFVLLFQQVQKF